MSAPRADRPVIREGGTGDKSGAVVALATALQAKTKRTAKTPRTQGKQEKNRKIDIVYVLFHAFLRVLGVLAVRRLFSNMHRMPSAAIVGRRTRLQENRGDHDPLYGAILLCGFIMDVFPPTGERAALVCNILANKSDMASTGAGVPRGPFCLPRHICNGQTRKG
jgi:hypothetical protein